MNTSRPGHVRYVVLNPNYIVKQSSAIREGVRAGLKAKATSGATLSVSSPADAPVNDEQKASSSKQAQV